MVIAKKVVFVTTHKYYINDMNFLKTHRLIQKIRSYAHFDPFKTIGFGFQYQKLYTLIESLCVSGKTVLDWGCGNGHFSWFLLNQKAEVSACDFNKPALFPNGTELYFKAINKYKPEKLPFPDDNFDYVFSIGVLEHVKESGGDELSSLREIQRVLKPQGLFVCYNLPNKYSFVHFFVGNFMKSHKYYHKLRYDKKDIKGLYLKTNYKIQKIIRYGILPKEMFNNLPGFISNNLFFIYFYYLLDDCLSLILNPFTTNFLVVAKKDSANRYI